jgi:hypothetical protein
VREDVISLQVEHRAAESAADSSLRNAPPQIVSHQLMRNSDAMLGESPDSTSTIGALDDSYRMHPMARCNTTGLKATVRTLLLRLFFGAPLHDNWPL